MARPEIAYALPVSCLEVSGTITETHDTILNVRSATPVTTVALHTHGVDRNQVVRILAGAMRDTSLALQLTEDGRLTSADVESTGQAGKVVIGAIGTGLALAGVLAGLPPVSATAAAVAAHERNERASVYLPQVEKEESPEEKIEAAYALRYPQMAALRQRYAALVRDALERIATIAQEMLEGSGAGQTEAVAFAQQQELLSVLRSELASLNGHFASWRESTIATHHSTRRRCFSLDVLRGAGLRVTDSGVTFGADADESVRFAWETLGVAIVMEPAGAAHRAPAEVRSNAVLVRVPRRTRLGVYENVAGRPVLRDERPYLVVDSACETHVVQFRRSLFAKRSTKLGFNDLGALSSFAIGSTSSAAALADSAAQLPQTVGSNLDAAGKVDQRFAELVKADGAGGSRPSVTG